MNIYEVVVAVKPFATSLDDSARDPVKWLVKARQPWEAKRIVLDKVAKDYRDRLVASVTTPEVLQAEGDCVISIKD